MPVQRPKTLYERTLPDRRSLPGMSAHVRWMRSISLETAAARLEMPPAQLHAREKGETEFSVYELLDLANFYGTPINFLIGRNYRERCEVPVPAAARDRYALDVAAMVSSMTSLDAKEAAFDAVKAILAANPPDGRW